MQNSSILMQNIIDFDAKLIDFDAKLIDLNANCYLNRSQSNTSIRTVFTLRGSAGLGIVNLWFQIGESVFFFTRDLPRIAE